MREKLRTLASLLNAIFGMPDYDRYLERRAARDPRDPLLTRREYYLQYLARRYDDGKGRCC